jgi:acetolactate synthase-1/2/3 large subunit
VIVWCDSDLGVISAKQSLELGKSVFTRFQNPDFVKLAESFGAVGYKVERTEDFKFILKKAKSSTNKPVIIAIDIDASRNKLLFEMNATSN